MKRQLLNAAATLESFQRRMMNLISFEGKEDNTKINGSEPVTSAEPVQPLDIDVKCVEKILNYKFENKILLVEAFTDPSYDEKSVSYERLEFLGDTILNTVITIEFYNIYPKESPGSLTKLRAANVDTEKLARVAVKHNLHRYLRHKKPLLDDQILEFVKAIEKDPTISHSCGLLKVPKSLADIVESTIGALFMDCKSTDTVWKNEEAKHGITTRLDLRDGGLVSTADGSALSKIGSTLLSSHMPPICSPIVRPGRPAEAAPVISKRLSDTILSSGMI